MINSFKMLEFVSAEPFQPFRIHMASGRHFDIRHPEMIRVGKTSITVHTYLDNTYLDSSDESAARREEVSLMLLESVEPMENASQFGKQ